MALILNILDTTFELCTADSSGGAVYSSAYYISSISNSRFINCTARNYDKILSGRAFGSGIRGCTFTHNANLPDLGAPTTESNTDVFDEGGYFQNCTFNNLKSNMPNGSKYLFNTWGKFHVGSNPGSVSGNVSLTLQDCLFNIDSDSAGILAMFGGINTGDEGPNYLMVDGVTINCAPGNKQGTLIYLRGSVSFITRMDRRFFFKKNNVFNGVTMTSASQITSAMASAVKLEDGASITIID